jgi:hypothetical protein
MCTVVYSGRWVYTPTTQNILSKSYSILLILKVESTGHSRTTTQSKRLCVVALVNQFWGKYTH